METASLSKDLHLGAVINQAGTFFRVWAPHAEKVFVTGTFNEWDKEQNPLNNEGNGFWSAEIAGANAGDQYKYIFINGQKVLQKNDPYAREVTSSAGNSVIYSPEFDWGGSDFRLSSYNEIVIYEMHIGTFNDLPEGPPGNFKSAIEKLSHLKELGINAIEVMPPMEFAGGFSWGYNPANIFAIETDYGGPTAFKEFIKKCHELGIGVIFDVVYNHFGPNDLELWQFDGWKENDKGGIYFYNDHRSQTPWGDTRPDYGREEVRRFISDNALMWLDDYLIDGLRWDMTAFIRNLYGNDNDPDNDIPEGWSLIQEVNKKIKEEMSDKISIAEDLKNNPFLVKDWNEGGAGFDSQWDAGFVHPVRENIIIPNDQDRNMNAIKDALSNRYGDNAFKRVIYTESHDEVANGKARVPHEISPNDPAGWAAKKRSTLGAALMFTAPGIPMIFQGQEFLEDKWFRDQVPLDWTKKDRYSGIMNMYRDLISLRLNQKGNTRGLCGEHLDVYHVNNEDKVIAFHRWDKRGPGDSVVVIFNMSDREFDSYSIGFPMEGKWLIRFNSDWSGYDPEFGNFGGKEVIARESVKGGESYEGALPIGPYSALILSQNIKISS